MWACWRLKAWIFNEQRVLSAKAKRTGARNDTRSLPPLPSPPPHYLYFSVDFITTGGMFTWFMKQINKGACRLWPDSWHMNRARICISACLQMASPLISCQPENDLDSAGWMCLHIYWWHCQSQSIAVASEERDALTVTKASVYLPSWWNTLQSHRSLLSSDCSHDGVNGYWSFWLADSQHILLDIFIFALDHKLPSVIRLHKGFRYQKKVYISLLSYNHEYSEKVKSLFSSWALYLSWLCPE